MRALAIDKLVSINQTSKQFLDRVNAYIGKQYRSIKNNSYFSMLFCNAVYNYTSDHYQINPTVSENNITVDKAIKVLESYHERIAVPYRVIYDMLLCIKKSVDAKRASKLIVGDVARYIQIAYAAFTREVSNNAIYPMRDSDFANFEFYGLQGQGYEAPIVQTQPAEVVGGVELHGGLYDDLTQQGANIRLMEIVDTTRNMPLSIRNAVERFYAPQVQKLLKLINQHALIYDIREQKIKPYSSNQNFTLYELQGFADKRFLYISNVYALSKMSTVNYTPDEMRKILESIVTKQFMKQCELSLSKLSGSQQSVVRHLMQVTVKFFRDNFKLHVEAHRRTLYDQLAGKFVTNFVSDEAILNKVRMLDFGQAPLREGQAEPQLENENLRFIQWIVLDKYFGVKVDSDLDFPMRSIRDTRDAEFFKDIYYSLYKLVQKETAEQRNILVTMPLQIAKLMFTRYQTRDNIVGVDHYFRDEQAISDYFLFNLINHGPHIQVRDGNNLERKDATDIKFKLYLQSNKANKSSLMIDQIYEWYFWRSHGVGPQVEGKKNSDFEIINKIVKFDRKFVNQDL